MALVQAMNTENYPNVAAASRKLANGDVRHEQQLIAYAKTCVFLLFMLTLKASLRGTFSQPFLHLKLVDISEINHQQLILICYGQFHSLTLRKF